jgi:DNA-binding MarR family transcriptional regulator
MVDRKDVDAEILDHLRTFTRALDRFMLPQLIDIGISMPQFKALIAVVGARDAGIPVTRLGSELRIGQPSASLIVDQLVESGYAERVPDPKDRRRVLVTATPRGIELHDDLRHGRQSTAAEWIADIDDAAAVELARGLSALIRSVEHTPYASTQE